jgi:hypothetical protein
VWTQRVGLRGIATRTHGEADMRIAIYIVMREARERVSSHLNGEGEEDYNGSIERERERMRGVQRDSSPKIEWKAVRVSERA